MKTHTRIMLILAFALVTVAVFGLQSNGSPAADGSALYKKHCVMCHGADGKGFKVLKTPDMTSPEWQASVTDEDIATVIKNGKKGTTMLPFRDKLTDDEIKVLITHIRSLNSNKK